MKKTKSKDDKHDKPVCVKCGQKFPNKGSLGKHKGSKACKRRQRENKAKKEKQPKRKKQAHRKRSKRKQASKKQPKPDKISTSEKKKTPKTEESPKAGVEAGVVTTLPPAPASDTPEIPNELEELREFTSDLGKNLREDAANELMKSPLEDSEATGLIDHSEKKEEPPDPDVTPSSAEDVTPRADVTGSQNNHELPDPDTKKRRVWPWILGGIVLLGGLTFLAVKLLKKKTPPPMKEELPKEDHQDGAIDPWDKS